MCALRQFEGFAKGRENTFGNKNGFISMANLLDYDDELVAAYPDNMILRPDRCAQALRGIALVGGMAPCTRLLA